MRKFDQSVCELIKRRNSLQHEARAKQQTLEQLLRQLAHMGEEAAAISSTPARESEGAKKLRELENRLDRAIIQCNEAAHVRKIYQRILEKMLEVQANPSSVSVPSHCLFVRRSHRNNCTTTMKLQIWRKQSESAAKT